MTNFKANNGKYFTRQLFHEEFIDLPVEKRATTPLFSLYRDVPGLVNFGKEYVRLRDPTGYKITQEHLDGEYNLWVTLMQCTWFMAAKEIWDRELDAAITSEALDRIAELSKDGLPAQRLAASKYLADREYRKDKTSSKGRPSKEEVTKEARHAAAIERELADDAKRIQLVKG